MMTAANTKVTSKQVMGTQDFQLKECAESKNSQISNSQKLTASHSKTAGEENDFTMVYDIDTENTIPHPTSAHITEHQNRSLSPTGPTSQTKEKNSQPLNPSPRPSSPVIRSQAPTQLSSPGETGEKEAICILHEQKSFSSDLNLEEIRKSIQGKRRNSCEEIAASIDSSQVEGEEIKESMLGNRRNYMGDASLTSESSHNEEEISSKIKEKKKKGKGKSKKIIMARKSVKKSAGIQTENVKNPI